MNALVIHVAPPITYLYQSDFKSDTLSLSTVISYSEYTNQRKYNPNNLVFKFTIKKPYKNILKVR